MYLAHVQDLFSRRIVGWAMADHLRSELVIDALEMALARRRPKPRLGSPFRSGLSIHGGAVREALRQGWDRGIDGLSRRLL